MNKFIFIIDFGDKNLLAAAAKTMTKPKPQPNQVSVDGKRADEECSESVTHETEGYVLKFQAQMK